MPDFALAALAQGGPWALIAFAVLAIFRGWLIPRSSFLREIGYLEKTIATQEKVIAERDHQIDALLGRVKEPSS